jgi:hypothetical protein
LQSLRWMFCLTTRYPVWLQLSTSRCLISQAPIFFRFCLASTKSVISVLSETVLLKLWCYYYFCNRWNLYRLHCHRCSSVRFRISGLVCLQAYCIWTLCKHLMMRLSLQLPCWVNTSCL